MNAAVVGSTGMVARTYIPLISIHHRYLTISDSTHRVRTSSPLFSPNLPSRPCTPIPANRSHHPIHPPNSPPSTNPTARNGPPSSPPTSTFSSPRSARPAVMQAASRSRRKSTTTSTWIWPGKRKTRASRHTSSSRPGPPTRPRGWAISA